MFEKVARQSLSHMKPYIPGRSIQEVAKEKGLTDIIKLASNENPLGCPVSWDELKDEFSHISQYPHQPSYDLISLLARKFTVAESQIILGNGSDELIQMVAAAFLNPGDEVVTSLETFSVYAFVTYLFDGQLVKIPLKNDAHDLTQFTDKVTPKTKLVFFANPNNPTGTYITHNELESFLKQIPSSVMVVMDEAYANYADADDFPNSVALMDTYPNLVMFRTFSKLYGLAGFRIGYAIGHVDVIHQLQKVRPPFNVNNLALKAAEIALGKTQFIQDSLELTASGKQFLIDQMATFPVTVVPSQTNFLCIHLPIPAKVCFEHMLNQGIIIRALDSFGMPNSIRVTIGTDSQNRRFVKELARVLGIS